MGIHMIDTVTYSILVQYHSVQSETATLQLALHRPDLLSSFANLQSMTNSNTSYHTDLPGGSHINTQFPQQASKMEATYADLRHISEVPGGCWRTNNRNNYIIYQQFQFSNFSGKLGTCANSGYQDLFPPTYIEPEYKASGRPILGVIIYSCR